MERITMTKLGAASVALAVFVVGFLVSAIYFSEKTPANGWDRSYVMSELVGSQIKDRQGEDIGSINDFVFDTHGKLAFAILSHENKLVAVPFETLTYDRTAGHLVLNTPKEKVDSAPNFDKGSVSDRKWAEEVYRHFGQRPSWTTEDTMAGRNIPENFPYRYPNPSAPGRKTPGSSP